MSTTATSGDAAEEAVLPLTLEPEAGGENQSVAVAPEVAKRGRGRPRKSASTVADKNQVGFASARGGV